MLEARTWTVLGSGFFLLPPGSDHVAMSLCAHKIHAEGRKLKILKLLPWFCLIYWSQGKAEQAQRSVKANKQDFWGITICTYSQLLAYFTPTPRGMRSQFLLPVAFFSSQLPVVELFTLLLSGRIRGKHLFLRCRPPARPKSFMGYGESLFLHVLVRSPFCSSLQGCSELPGWEFFYKQCSPMTASPPR